MWIEVIKDTETSKKLCENHQDSCPDQPSRSLSVSDSAPDQVAFHVPDGEFLVNGTYLSRRDINKQAAPIAD